MICYHTASFGNEILGKYSVGKEKLNYLGGKAM